MSGFWSDTKDIQLEIMKTLPTFSQMEDLTGWVKGNETVDTVVLTDELARLSKENADLREENNQLREASTDSSNLGSLGVSYEEMKSILENTLITPEDKVATFSEDSQDFIETFKNKNIIILLDFLEYLKDDLVRERLILAGSNAKLLFEKSNSKQERNCLILLCEKRIITFFTQKPFKANDNISMLIGNHYVFQLTEEGYKFLNWLHAQKNKKRNELNI
ncbi:MAG: hypothetical protein AAF349_27925 [Cyanobacteria bacterium P01_A01_bin.68]